MFSSDLFCFLTYWATAQHPDETRQRFVRMRGAVMSGCTARFCGDARRGFLGMRDAVMSGCAAKCEECFDRETSNV